MNHDKLTSAGIDKKALAVLSASLAIILSALVLSGCTNNLLGKVEEAVVKATFGQMEGLRVKDNPPGYSGVRLKASSLKPVLLWEPAGGSGAVTAAGYSLEWGTDRDDLSTWTTVRTTEPKYEFLTELDNCTTYYWRVTAFTRAGHQGESSAINCFHTAGNVELDFNSPSNNNALIFVPAGKFKWNNAESAVAVITKPYLLSWTEISRFQFQKIMGEDPSVTTHCGRKNPQDNPVQNVSWYMAIAFCNKLSLQSGLTPVYKVSSVPDWATLAFTSIPSGSDDNWNKATCDWNANGYRLPTSMEYMWAAMGAPASGQNGGTNLTGYLKPFAGSDLPGASFDMYVRSPINSDPDEDGINTTISVIRYNVESPKANELGFRDLSGNVAEWCWDYYSSALEAGPLVDYRGPSDPDSFYNRIIRGGDAFYYTDDIWAIAKTEFDSPSTKSFAVGFRVARNAP